MSRTPEIHVARAHSGLRESMAVDARQSFGAANSGVLWDPLIHAELGSLDLGRGLFDSVAAGLHVLWTYQQAWVEETFLSTARLESSVAKLLGHIGYRPSPGTAAVGFQHFRVKAGTSGILPAGFQVKSKPKGEAEEATFETLQPLRLEPALNDFQAFLPPAVGGAESGSGAPSPFPSSQSGEPQTPSGGLFGPGSALAGIQDRIEVQRHGLFEERRVARAKQEARRLAGLAKSLELDGDPACKGAFDKLCAQLCEAQKVAATPVAPSGKLPGALSESQEILSRQLRNLMKRQKDAALALEEALAPCTDEDPSLYAKRLDRMAAFLDAFVGGLVQEARDQLVLLRGTEALNRLEATFSPDRERPLGTAPSGTDSLYLPPMPSDTPGGLPVAPPLRPGDWVAVAEALERLGPAGQVVSERVYREVVRVVRVRSEVPAGQREPMSLVHFVPPLGRTYPLSRVTLVGNIVPVSHGEAVEEWVTPSADRRTLRLNESPVTWLRDKARAQGRRAEVSLRVAGRAWAQVDSLLEWGRDEQVFSVESLPEGAARIRVGGDGSGAPLPEGAELRVKYRVGRGTAGNVESGRVTELASPHPCVESTLNPLPFSGGSEPEAPDTARTQGPATVGVMDRAVSLPDVEALARVFDGVDRAKVVRDDVRRRVLKVVLSGPGGAALSTEELNALHSFLAVRVPPGVTLHLSNRVVAPVRAKVLLRVQPGADPISVIQQARLALGLDADPGSPPGLLDPRNVALGADLDLSQLYEALAKVDGLRSSVVQQLYRADAAPSLSQRVVTGFNELLAWALPEGKSDGVELTYEEAREL